MTLNIILKAFVVWLGILLLAIMNGAVREIFFIPELGNASGLILSGFLLSICILFAAYLMLPWIGKVQVVNYVFIGIGWLCITLLFEFIFGRAQGKSWSQLFDAYIFKDGNIWPIILLVIAIAPYISAKIKGWA